MRLIVIGRNPQEASIVLNSQYISNYHAEIILLDNGDMFLIDKSTNGTFLNGMRLTPGKEVAIKRGDNILFADVPLDWNLIDPIKVPKDVKVIKGVGSHYMNAINVQGSNVSRFHATIRQMADNKWYICDHSKNGTTVNNVRIQRDRFIRIKKSDEIACAGVPIQNPIPSGGFSFKWVAIVAVVACLTALAMIIPPMMKWSPEKIARTYSPSVAWMVTFYHFEVSCPGLEVLLEDDEYREFRLIYDQNDKENKIAPFRQFGSMHSQGTAFFIGDEKYIVTNRHVARPWEYADAQYSYSFDNFIEEAEVLFRNYLLNRYPSVAITAHIGQLKIKGVLDGTFIIPHGSEYDEHNQINCREIAVGSMEEDLAIFKVKNNLLPNVASIPFDMISTKELSSGNKIYTAGFPNGVSLQYLKEAPLQVYFSDGLVSTTQPIYKFGVTATSDHGASGSPVFDKYGKLVGIINSGYEGTQGYNYAIKAEYLVKLINSANITK